MFPNYESLTAVNPEKKHLDVAAHALESQNAFTMESSRWGSVMVCIPDAKICEVNDDYLGIRSGLRPVGYFTGRVSPLCSQKAVRLPDDRAALSGLWGAAEPSCSGEMRRYSTALPLHPTTDHTYLPASIAASYRQEEAHACARIESFRS